MRHLRGRLLLLLLTLWFSTTPVDADYYRYTDEKGGVGFVDDIKKIPSSCRASATLIREAKPVLPPEEAPNPYLSRPQRQDGAPYIASEQPSMPAPAATPATTLPATSANAQKPWHWGWLALCLAAAGASVALLYQLLKTLQSPQLTRVILIGVTVGVLLFGYKLYVDQMVANYFTVKGKVLQLMDQAMKRTDSNPAANTHLPADD